MLFSASYPRIKGSFIYDGKRTGFEIVKQFQTLEKNHLYIYGLYQYIEGFQEDYKKFEIGCLWQLSPLVNEHAAKSQ